MLNKFFIFFATYRKREQYQLESNAPTTIPSNYAYIEQYVWGQNQGHAFLAYNYQINDEIELETSLSYNFYEVNPDSNFYVIQNAELSEAAPSYKYALSESTKIDTQMTWITDAFTLVAGIFYENIESFPKTQNLVAPFDDGGALVDDLSAFVDENGLTFGLLGLTESQFGQRNYFNRGGFGQVQFDMSEKAKITLGARYDYNSLFKDTVNPRASLVYLHSESLTSRLTYGSAYIQPSNYYRWENWGNPFAMHIPNIDIQPETIDSYGYAAVYFAENYSLSLDLYYNQLKDVIRPSAAPAQADNYPYFNPFRAIIGEQPDTGFVEINANQGEITTYGGEFEFTHKYGELLTKVSYSYVDGDDGGFSIAKTSKHKINVNLNYAVNEKWKMGSSLRYFSAVNTTASNSQYGSGASGELDFAGAFVVYLNTIYEVNDAISINLALDNLLDRKFHHAAPYAESIWIQPRAPQAGRKIWINMQAVF